MAASVLVIDDDSTVRDSMIAFLDDYEYRAAAAGNATEALESIARSIPDIVVCDLKMPGMHGIELLELIKKDYPDLPVIVVSGAGVMDDVVKALRLGADDFLVKPILDLEVLHHALKKALQRARLECDNRAYREHLEKTNRELQRGLNELRADQQAGRQAQLRMLPDPLDYESIHCEHLIYPSLMLSGDFLDYFELGDNQLAFYIADVSGHGASSAFVTVLLKNLTYRLRRNRQRGSSDDLMHPAQVLDRINSELLASELEKHLTMFYGVIDTRTLEMRYSVGGHFPMPVLLDDEGGRYLEGRGMPVGLFREAQYQEYSATLKADFALLMFSDGILEIMKESTLNDKEALLLDVAVRSRGDLSVLTSELGAGTTDDLPDDIALMAVRRGRL
ncbi:MAG: fused response regulator/phosphatase [Oceanospirillaceae bacterium]|uniref:PP2C family protein-serine/threonine phosphatase n=1 Tax=unclassified Thalassolituus TaxID=2624967 RepID=UPI000C48CA54|nr:MULTISPECIES: fused response regulator/phosphatase [unclassified Thalassolituus]MAX97821.1 fused response regulator/phosphatase [Oceanospirillaceae bacterium]MBL34827.1 fused response regulator/phosphatase [Oceanospirillaceae bacterium]MBS53447.1 fused response regulator/phosphatase [Oceanospirillaceae bacterium]|tara:strand:+ start:390 stop:1562 length:1173 start_codon:yes stop_codon:yes gene_type:complete